MNTVAPQVQAPENLALVLNSGSSSIKFQLVDPKKHATDEPFASGLVEQIGEKQGTVTLKFGGEKYTTSAPIPDHSAGLDMAFALMGEHGCGLEDVHISAVGHRVVHGGVLFSQPVIITDEVLGMVRDLIPLAPLHNPANIDGIEVARNLLSDVPHVAVFDTGFFSTVPPAAAVYAINAEVAAEHGVRRYGFHGTSHEYVSHVAADMLGIARDEFNGVVAHLGNGASVTAVKGGKSVDTSMGYTPLAGLVMGTRSGDIDPSALTTILTRDPEIDAERLDTILNKESGLLALAGSNDMRKVVESAQSGDERAQLALDMTAYRLMKYIGGYNLVVGGAQALIFTAGIGENSGDFRKLVLDRLAPLGIRYNEEENMKRSPEPRLISTEDSSIAVFVIPTNEEKAIAEATEELVA